MVAQSVSFAFVGCSVFELLHDLAEVSPKCTEDRCYIQYGIANVQFLSIGDDMNLDGRWWHVHTQSKLGETCLHGCPVSFFCFCWVLRLRAFVMILQKSLQNAIKTDVRSNVVYQMLGVQSGVEAFLLSVSRCKFWYSQWLVSWLEFLVQTGSKRSLISIYLMQLRCLSNTLTQLISSDPCCVFFCVTCLQLSQAYLIPAAWSRPVLWLTVPLMSLNGLFI